MDTPQIEWRLTTADKSYNPFEVDKTNINTALGRLGGYDILAKQEELDAVNHDLTLPVTPDDITQPIASRLHGLCNSADKKPLMFKAEYNARSPDEGLTSMYIQIPVYDGQPAEDAKYKAWMRTDLNWFDCIRALNKVPYASRGEVRFLFMVTFGNAPGGLKWSVGRWMEVGMHEIGVRE